MKLSLGRQHWRALIDVRQAVRVFALAIVLSTTPSCGGGCPKPQVTNQQRSIWERQLAQCQLVPLEPQGSISIKRDVHTLRIAAEAGAFAQAFHQVMTDPERRFGLIRVERMQTNLGRPFQVGERFQGRYDLQDAIKEQLPGKRRRGIDYKWDCKCSEGSPSQEAYRRCTHDAPEPPRDGVGQWRARPQAGRSEA